MLILAVSDKLSLGYGYTIESTSLVDSIVDARHALDKRVVPLLTELCYDRITYQDAQSSLRALRLKNEESDRLIETLATIGALNVDYDPRAILQRITLRLNAFVLRQSVTAIAHRAPTTFVGVAVSLIKSTAILLALWIFACSLAVASGVFSAPYFILHSLGAYAILLVSLVAHEYSHVVTLGKSRDASTIVRSAWRVGILHTPQATRTELTSSIVGPCVGASLALASGLVLYNLTHTYLWQEIGIVFAACHCLSLLPNFGDGWSIMKVFARKHNS